MPASRTASALVDGFALAAWAGARVHDPAALATLLAEVLVSARTRWPAIVVRDDLFVAYLAARVESRAWVEDALAEMATDDLYLACGCVLGNAEALRELDHNCFPRLENVLVRSGFATSSIADVLQDLRARLLVRHGADLPRLVKYGGRAKLVTWLSVLARRDALAKHGRRQDMNLELDEELSETLASDIELGVELEAIRREAREIFSRGFATALAALPARDRRLLREVVLGGIGHGELAARFGVDRTTILRRIQRAEATLRVNLRRFMIEQGRLSPPEYESVMRVLSSARAGLSVEDALGTTAEHPSRSPADVADAASDDCEK